ncbi:hypothetical protein BS17DRAFT_769640 [Gyrodon lividus]|nr:hypothetical protein BS17DRAFT_769640 [Gyrodon lividus]
MDYHTYPTQHPDDAIVTSNARATLGKHFGAGPAPDNMVSIHCLAPDDQILARVVMVPVHYITHILNLLFGRYVLALILVNGTNNIIKPYKWWACFAQNYLHLARIWEKLQHEITEELQVQQTWHLAIFDSFIMTEAMVMQHKLVYVNWSTHERRLARLKHFSGSIYGGRIPPSPPSHDMAKHMLVEASNWYDNGNRPMIMDAYLKYWVSAGWEPKDIFDPNVEDMKVVEKEEKKGKGEGDNGGEDTVMREDKEDDNNKEKEEEEEEEKEEEKEEEQSASMGPTPRVQGAVTRKRDHSGSNIAAVCFPPSKKPVGGVQR